MGGWIEHGGLVVEFSNGQKVFIDNGTLGGIDGISYPEDVPANWEEFGIQPLEEAKGMPSYVDWDSLGMLPSALWDLLFGE